MRGVPAPAADVAGLLVARLLRVALRLSSRRVGLVLVYHGVGPPSGDARTRLVPAHDEQLFEAQLRHLRRAYRVVAVDELLEAAAARRRGERFPVAVTFDDDLPSHSRVAAPLLERSGVPAAFFLCGASLVRPFAFWWERLQLAVDRRIPGVLDAGSHGSIQAFALEIEALPAAERDAFAARLATLLGPDPEDAGLRAEDVRLLAASGFGIGFHTLRHDRLPPLDDDALALALSEGRAELEEAAGSALTAIAYPHGRSNARVAAAARGAGFRLGFTGSATAVGPGSDPLLLGRIEPSHRSLWRFALQLARALASSPQR